MRSSMGEILLFTLLCPREDKMNDNTKERLENGCKSPLREHPFMNILD